MDINYIGVVLSTIGILLTVWALWYARVQGKKVSDLRRNEMISLWAFLDRIGTIFAQVQLITDDEGYIESGKLSPEQRQVIPKIHKALADQYIRVVEIIVKKSPELTFEDIERWKKIGIINSEWRKMQFVNLLAASKSTEEIPKEFLSVSSSRRVE